MAKRLKGEKEKKQLFQTKKKIIRKEEKEEETKLTKRKTISKAFLGAFKSKRVKVSRRKVSQRARGTKRLVSALGGTESRGRGRPEGTYKYGMPIGAYKKLQSRTKALQQQYQQEQMGKLRRRGITPEQLRQMQLRRTIEEGTVQPRQLMSKGDVPERMVDDELEFKRWVAKKHLSPSAEAILKRLRRTQNMGKAANIRQQRIQEERRIISQKGNLMRAHENMIDVRVDFSGVSQDNILMADNTFRENPENNILRKREGARHILDTVDNIMIPKRRLQY